MKVDTYQCDVCHEQKKDSNHWFKGYQAQGTSGNIGFLISPWSANPHRQPSVQTQTVTEVTFVGEAHLCGAKCVTEWLSKSLLT